MTAPIAHVRCTPPPGWMIWPAGDGYATAERAAATSESPTASALAAAVRAFDDETTTDHPGTQLAGLWQPDATSAPVASMRILLSSRESPRMTADELLAFAWQPPTVDGLEVLDVAADPGHLAAGPAVAQIVRGVHRPARTNRNPLTRLLSGGDRRVLTHITWYVLPPGTDQVVACRFETADPYLLEDLGAQTNAITDSLLIDLEHS